MPQRPRPSRVAVVSAVLVLLALVAVPLSTAAAKNERHGHHHPTIAEARAMPLGTVVTIEGTVTTPSGVFASSFFDEGFAVQDATAGIFVSFPDTDVGVQPPRHVRVRTGSVGESTEGSLVRAVGVITQGPIQDGDFGHKLSIDDGSGEITVFVNLGTDVDVQPLAVGQLIEVTGFSSQFSDHYDIDVRGPQDLAQPVR